MERLITPAERIQLAYAVVCACVCVYTMCHWPKGNSSQKTGMKMKISSDFTLFSPRLIIQSPCCSESPALLVSSIPVSRQYVLQPAAEALSSCQGLVLSVNNNSRSHDCFSHDLLRWPRSTTNFEDLNSGFHKASINNLFVLTK